MRGLPLLLAGILVLVNLSSNAQTIDEVVASCANTEAKDKTLLYVTDFRVSAPSVALGFGHDFATMITTRLASVNCFAVNKVPGALIPDGTSALITGNVRGYITSNDMLGVATINFDLEVRNAVTQEVVASRNIKGLGKLYKGTGPNKPLENLLIKVVDEAVLFIHKQLPTILTLPKAVESKEEFMDTTLRFKERVRTKSIYDQMKDKADDERAENKYMALMISDYYNDTVLYKTFPKRPDDQFIEYSINGKKYAFQVYAKDVMSTASVLATEGRPSKYGVQIRFEPSRIACAPTIDMFYPTRHINTRKFYFGEDAPVDSKVPSAKENATFSIFLCGGFKEGMTGFTASEKFQFVASNKPEHSSMVNIEHGFVQVLHFETGNSGIIECIFSFQTEAYKDKTGKDIPAMKIEGRFRGRGAFGFRKY